ncbi:MAG: hypothetical protein U5N86_13640 [Planctomycetota bacterium]|nr:hypothetical protein [Planctomycetota bacterium]
MTLLPPILSLVLAAAFLSCAFVDRKGMRKAVTTLTGLLLIAGVVVYASFARGSTVWLFDHYANALHLASGWAGAFVAVMAAMMMGAFRFVNPDSKPSVSFWILLCMISLTSGFFALTANMIHLEPSLFSGRSIAGFLVLLALAEGIAAEHIRDSSLLRKAACGDSALFASVAAAVLILHTVSRSGSLGFNDPLFVLSVGVALISFGGFVAGEKSRLPLMSVFSLLWLVSYGLWLE